MRQLVLFLRDANGQISQCLQKCLLSLEPHKHYIQYQARRSTAKKYDLEHHRFSTGINLFQVTNVLYWILFFWSVVRLTAFRRKSSERRHRHRHWPDSSQSESRRTTAGKCTSCPVCDSRSFLLHTIKCCLNIFISEGPFWCRPWENIHNVRKQ